MQSLTSKNYLHERCAWKHFHDNHLGTVSNRDRHIQKQASVIVPCE